MDRIKRVRGVVGSTGARRLVLCFTVLPLVAGCDVSVGTAATQGPARKLCGQEVSRAQDMAGSGPFFVDGADADVTFTARAASSGTWVSVASDCVSGSRVELPVTASVEIDETLSAPGGADLAVLLTPVDPGDAVVRVIHPDGSLTTITVHVTTKTP